MTIVLVLAMVAAALLLVLLGTLWGVRRTKQNRPDVYYGLDDEG